jgi:FKBP-type peptidyl-prolyl cis-trans isomerase
MFFYEMLTFIVCLASMGQGSRPLKSDNVLDKKELASLLVALSPTATRTARSELRSRRQTLDRLLRVRGGDALDISLDDMAKPIDAGALQALGQMFGASQGLSGLSVFSDDELDAILVGLKKQVLSKGKMGIVQADLQMGSTALENKWDAIGDKEEKAGKLAIEAAAAEKNAKKTSSGLVIQTLEKGSGESPTLENTVKVRLEGALLDGTPFVIGGSEPLEVQVSKLQEGLKEGLLTMKPGGKAKLTIPHELAYGNRFVPPHIPPRATVVFQVELLEVK